MPTAFITDYILFSCQFQH